MFLFFAAAIRRRNLVPIKLNRTHSDHCGCGEITESIRNARFLSLIKFLVLFKESIGARPKPKPNKTKMRTKHRKAKLKYGPRIALRIEL